MLLTFVRHAEASNADSDFERELTERGKQQAKQLAVFFASIKNKPELILTSPLIRARQTAEAIKQKLGESASLLKQPWLSCGMQFDVLLKEISAFKKVDNILLVGHEPDFSTIIAFLLGNPCAGNLQVRKASVSALEIRSFRAGGGILQYFFPPDLLSSFN